MKRRSVLKHLIRNLLKEADDPIADPDLEGDDSLDSQVDRYLADFEGEAQNLKKEGTDFRMFMRRFLTEAEDEEEGGEEGAEDEEEGAEDELDDMLGDESSSDEPEQEPEKLKSEDIEMTNFVTSVMRLVDNYDSLLEVRNTILRRAAKFIKDKYEPDALVLFKQELLESFGMKIGKSEKDMEDDLDVPGAARGSAPIESAG